MKIIDPENVKIKETPHKVDVRPMYDHENAQALLITLKRGESLLPHITPVDVFFFVHKGRGQVRVGDEIEEVSEGMVIESPRDMIHSLMNPFEDEFRVLVVKAPRPVSASRIL
ncbi:MAG: cupin domain-containing protein [Candidatus Thermoplasmatota archaeon]|nr:cupin domain-containing protein [Candidatus Thermoplasmatota archaeon]